MKCPDCVAHEADLGAPSEARWRGPDGVGYCSIHLIRRFGHGERLVRLDGFTPPAKVKPPAPKRDPKVVEA